MIFYFIPLFFASLLCLIEEGRIFKLDKFFYFCGFLTIGLIGGLRFETGMDWNVYQNYFSSINLALNPIASYESNTFQPAFEIGYFYFNYFVKSLGGSCNDVFLIASVFCSSSVYYFTSRIPAKRWYILVAYICFNFPYLHFATVRQSIAVAFFMLAAAHYVKTSKKFTSILFASIALLFQVSSLVYIALMLLSFMKKKGTLFLIILISVLLFVFILSGFDSTAFYLTLSKPLFFHAVASKLLFYSQTGINKMSLWTYFFGASMLLFTAYIYRYRDLLNSKFTNFQFFADYAVNSLMMTSTAMIMFYSTFAMWTRLYNVASVFQACAISLILINQKNKWHKFIIPLGLCLNFLLYYYFLTHGFKTLIPYRSILTN